jgi:hypothetical protein
VISDLVPNPFVGREIVGRLLGALRARGFDEAKLERLAKLIIEELRKGLDAERTARAEAIFKEAVGAGQSSSVFVWTARTGKCRPSWTRTSLQVRDSSSVGIAGR